MLSGVEVYAGNDDRAAYAGAKVGADNFYQR